MGSYRYLRTPANPPLTHHVSTYYGKFAAKGTIGINGVTGFTAGGYREYIRKFAKKTCEKNWGETKSNTDLLPIPLFPIVFCSCTWFYLWLHFWIKKFEFPRPEVDTR